MGDLIEYLPLLVDYTTLVYHEARNVRHLIRKRVVEPEVWKYLVSLPENKSQAWKALQGLREKAKQANSVQESLRQFENRFRVTLEQLQILYGHAAWRSEAYGGNKWKDITIMVRHLAYTLENEQVDEINNVLEMLFQARHNTGLLVEKLHKLDDELK
jgi:hypothetical protein